MSDVKCIKNYIDSLIPANGSEEIEEIRSQAVSQSMPIIRRDGEQFLKTLLCLKHPKRILEIGTCIGYSAIIMADNTDEDCCIHTLEIGKTDYEMALDNIKKAGYEKRIFCYLCDATDKLKEFIAEGAHFDFVFLDAAKGQYINWLGDITVLLEKGGVLLSDNVLHDGDIIESRFAVDRRDRTTHARLREYLYTITHSRDYESTVLNVADGMSLSIKK